MVPHEPPIKRNPSQPDAVAAGLCACGVFAARQLEPEAQTLLFVLSVLAIVPLAALLSHATESVAAKTGDAAGGLLNATLGNLTELVQRFQNINMLPFVLAIGRKIWYEEVGDLGRGIHGGTASSDCVGQ
jgi:hypothetical protein